MVSFGYILLKHTFHLIISTICTFQWKHGPIFLNQVAPHVIYHMGLVLCFDNRIFGRTFHTEINITSILKSLGCQLVN